MVQQKADPGKTEIIEKNNKEPYKKSNTLGSFSHYGIFGFKERPKKHCTQKPEINRHFPWYNEVKSEINQVNEMKKPNLIADTL
ncbi:MAG: hypothetical protein P8107_03275 [Spirochaetia bacterium]